MTYLQIASFEADTGLPFRQLAVAYIVVVQIVAVQTVVVDFAARIGFERPVVADLGQPARKLEIVAEWCFDFLIFACAQGLYCHLDFDSKTGLRLAAWLTPDHQFVMNSLVQFDQLLIKTKGIRLRLS